MGSIINCFSYWFHLNVLRWARTYIIMGRSIVSKPKMCLEYFLSIFKYLLYLFVSVFDQLSLELFCPSIQPRIFLLCNCCNTKKAWVRGRKNGAAVQSFQWENSQKCGNRRKCLADGTGHADSGCVPECSQWFPLFVTAPLWGARPLPPSWQLWERHRDAAVARPVPKAPYSKGPCAFLLKKVPVIREGWPSHTWHHWIVTSGKQLLECPFISLLAALHSHCA